MELELNSQIALSVKGFTESDPTNHFWETRLESQLKYCLANLS